MLNRWGGQREIHIIYHNLPRRPETKRREAQVTSLRLYDFFLLYVYIKIHSCPEYDLFLKWQFVNMLCTIRGWYSNSFQWCCSRHMEFFKSQLKTHLITLTSSFVDKGNFKRTAEQQDAKFNHNATRITVKEALLYCFTCGVCLYFMLQLNWIKHPHQTITFFFFYQMLQYVVITCTKDTFR